MKRLSRRTFIGAGLWLVLGALSLLAIVGLSAGSAQAGNLTGRIPGAAPLAATPTPTCGPAQANVTIENFDFAPPRSILNT